MVFMTFMFPLLVPLFFIADAAGVGILFFMMIMPFFSRHSIEVYFCLGVVVVATKCRWWWWRRQLGNGFGRHCRWILIFRLLDEAASMAIVAFLVYQCELISEFSKSRASLIFLL